MKSVVWLICGRPEAEVEAAEQSTLGKFPLAAQTIRKLERQEIRNGYYQTLTKTDCRLYTVGEQNRAYSHVDTIFESD